MQSWLRFFPEQASSVAHRVDALYFYLVGISVFFSTLIFIVVIYFAIKYRRRSEDEPPPQPIPDYLPFEITWIVVPLILVMIAFFWGANVFFALARPPQDALEIFVVGRQWMWKFQHPDGQREINSLHVPVGLPVKLTMASEDVIHSFFVPAFRVKHDVVPGYYTTVWFEATKAGTYHLFCAEYCGTQHSGMIGRLVALEPKEYEAWLSGAMAARAGITAPQAGLELPEGSPAAEGRKLFMDLGCQVCHRTDRQGIGPVLVGLFGGEVRLDTGQTVIVDENYLRESILNPPVKVAAGFRPLMPPFAGRVNEEQIMQLIAYIKSLGGKTAARETKK
jgi:cytochrome c oxidase subunit 2